MDIHLLIALLPVVFMLHDFEEIVMFRPWLDKNRAAIAQRYPRIDRVLARHHDKLTTSAYAVAVLHEFALLSVITFVSLGVDSYRWWFAAFMAFTLHLFVHIGQWIVFRAYVPCIVTSLAAMPYCLYTLARFVASTDMSGAQLVQWTLIGVVLTMASFVPAFALAGAFERWKSKVYLGR